MCIAIPGKVIEINQDEVVVDYGKEKRTAKSLLDVNVGDYVIISGHIITEKIPKEEAIQAIEIMTKFNYNGT